MLGKFFYLFRRIFVLFLFGQKTHFWTDVLWLSTLLAFSVASVCLLKKADM